MVRVIKFQGRTITLPDGATDEQVRQVLQSSPEAAPAPTAVPAAPDPYLADLPVPRAVASAETPEPVSEPSLIDHIMGGAGYLGETAAIAGDRFGEGMANVAGLPVDIINALPMLANVIPGVDGVGPISPNPVGGSDWLNDVRTGAGLVDYQAPVPQDPFQTVVGRVGEELGASALPMAGLGLAGARMGAKVARESANPFVRTLVAPAAASPGHFVASEVGGATAAGMGAGIANLFSDRNTTGGQIADMAGALGGAGALGVATTVGRGLGGVASAIFQRKKYVDQTVKDAVVDRIGKAAGLPGSGMTNGVFDTDPLVAAIMEPNVTRPSDIIPGFQESLADVTRNPGIAALEYSRQSGPNAGEFTRQRSENNDLVDTIMRQAEPTETPGAFRSELEARRDMRLSAAAEKTQAAQSEFDRYIQSLVPTMTADARGSDLRAAIESASDEAKQIVSAAWDPINNSSAQIDMAPLADSYGSLRKGLSTAEERRFLPNEAGIPKELVNPEVPPEPNGLLDASGRPMMREGKPASGIQPIKEVTGLRSALSDAANEASSAGRANEARIVRQHIQALDDYFESAIPSELSAQYEEAKALRRDYGDRFERQPTAIAQVRAKSDGVYRVDNSGVAPKFVQPDEGRLSDFEDLMREAGNDPRTRATIRDQILADIERSRALSDPAQLEQHLQQYSTVFSKFPDLRDEITQAVASGRVADEATGAQATLESDVGSADGTVKGRGPVGRYLQYSDAQSERAITEVLNSKDPAKTADELLSFVDDNPRAAEGARAAFWQKLRTESQSVDNSQRTMSGGRAWRGDWLKSFLDKPATAAVAERLYRDQPEALANIRAYADVLDNVDLRQRGKAAGTSGTAQGVNPVLTPETLQSRFYAYMRGQVSGTYLATSIAAVVARRAVRNAQTDAIERLTDQVLLNPELAAQLLKDNNPANRAALAKKARTWLGNEASTLVNLMDEDDDGNGRPLEIEVDTKPGTVVGAEQGDDEIWRAVMR